MKKTTTLFFITFLACFIASAQMKHTVHSKTQDSRILVLKNNFGTYKTLKFKAGDNFTFRINANRKKYKATLSHIDLDAIMVFGTDVPLSSISWVEVDNPYWLVQQGSIYLPIASVAYFAMDMINPMFSGEQSFQFSRQTLLTSSTFMLAGVILYLFKKKRYRIYKGLYVLKTESR